MIQTHHEQRPVRIPRIERKRKHNMHDISKAICITSYMESLLDNLDRLVEMNINDKVKASMSICSSQHYL